jgi:hypothetical protein
VNRQKSDRAEESPLAIVGKTVRPLARLAGFYLLLASIAGCSLISLKSPEKPLSKRDLDARILTREYSARFIASVAQTADEISFTKPDSEAGVNALKWKIAASAQSERAAGQMAPMMAVLDTWALSIQMSDYLANGDGQSLFGDQQVLAATLASRLASEAEDLARRLTTPDEFAKDQSFVTDYVRTNPIVSLHFARASVVDAWTRNSGAGAKLVDSLGTVPEALADAGDRLRMYGDTGPEQLLWRAQLAAQESGISGTDVRGALQRLDERVARLYALADATPSMVNGIVRSAGVRFDASWAEMMRDVRDEGMTLTGTLSVEREAALNALEAQRTAVAADAERISKQVIAQAGDEARRLIRDALLLVIALVLVLLGVPFFAGYAVGRARASRHPT